MSKIYIETSRSGRGFVLKLGLSAFLVAGAILCMQWSNAADQGSPATTRDRFQARGARVATMPSSSVIEHHEASAVVSRPMHLREIAAEGDRLPDAHRQLLDFQSGAMAMRHVLQARGDFLSQDRNPSTLAAEQSLAGYFQAAAGSPSFDVSVKCKATVCEVLARVYSSTSTADWEGVIEGMQHQPWWDGFSGESTVLSEQNGQSVMITYLHRRA